MDDKDSTPQNGMDTDVDAGNGNGSDDDTGNVDTPGMPLVDTVLSFVMHGLNSGTPDNVLKIALSTFTVLEVRESVRKLWKHCNLRDLPVRHNTQRRTECSALLTDIIQKFQYLDEAGTVPYLCCDVIGLSRIPKFQIEDITDIAMADRIRRLEVKLLLIDEKVCEHFERFVQIPNVDNTSPARNAMKPPVESLVSDDGQQTSVVPSPRGRSATLTAEMTLNPPSTKLSGALDSRRNNKDSTRKEDRSTDDRGDSSSTTGEQVGNVSGKRGESGKKSYSRTLTNGLNEPKFCMFSGPRKAFGTATQSRLKVAQESFKHLFTTGFDKDCTPDDVMQHMQHNKIRFKFVKKIPCKDDDYRASFKLTVPFSAYEHAFSSDSWPPGIYIREFYPRTKAQAPVETD